MIGWKTIYETPVDPYLFKVWIGQLYLHVFHRGDNDPDPHDHPRGFWTFPLTSYVEEVTVPILHVKEPDYWTRRQVVKAFRLHYRPAEHTHRVLGRWDGDYEWTWARPEPSLPSVKPGKIVTIVWWESKQRTREWGFLKNRDGKWCWVAWRDYVFGGGKHGPCE